MARLIYAFLALSLGTLVAGFLIRDSSVPLFVSIGLSALVLVLILVGTSRRLRRANELEDERTDLADLEIVEVDDTEAVADITPRKARPPRARRTSTTDVDTQSMQTQTLEELLAADDTLVDDAQTEVVDAPSRRSAASPRRRPSRTARPRRDGAVTEPVGDRDPADADDELAPMLEIEEAEAEPTDVVAGEPPTASEPPLTIEMPPPRKAARRRRPERASASEPEPVVPDRPRARPAATTPSPAASPPGLAPKVWVIPGRSRYHTQDCRFAKGDTLREVTEATAQRRGYVPCNVCKPGSS